MEITNESPEWDVSEDRVILSQFLQSRTGQRLLPKLLENVPALLTEGEINKILIRSGEVIGWGAVVRNLLALSIPEPKPPEPEVSEYPPLVDDKAWNDGKQLTANKA